MIGTSRLAGAMTRSRVFPYLVSAGLCLAMACGGDESSTGPRAPIPVRVKVVDKAADAPPTRYSGTIVPATQVDLAFRVGG